MSFGGNVGKNIVVCCDGTANEFAKNKTNVLKLYSTLVQNSASQVTFYHPGIGTMEPAQELSPLRRKFAKVLGLAVGYGLENDIRDAYVFLMRNYSPGDRVYLFGFSRGAYTVRAVASLLHMYGLIRPDNEPLVPYAIRLMVGIKRGREDDPAQKKAVDEYFDLAADFKRTMSCGECRPLFAGVWDTVSSVGWVGNPLKLPFSADNPSIDVGRHAVAIDEKRAFFRTNLWRPKANGQGGPKDMKQVWFAGVHCDVGGGYEEGESGLSKIALQWMLQEAEACGLLVDPAARAAVLAKGEGPNPNGIIHQSLKGLWNVAELVPKPHWNWEKREEERRCNLWRRRTIPPDQVFHESVRQRDGGKYFASLSPSPKNPRFIS